ncbi:indole-3-glycerol phosphate synthase [Bacteroidales bacterium]|nr:indole-3-glycerol phosphate synthase [Bacteroidales bacterium]
MNILETIIFNKKKEVLQQKALIPFLALEKIIAQQAKPRLLSLKAALETSSTGIIAEFKRKSPSKGWIAQEANVQQVAQGYQQAGACGISVLTDEQFFGGNISDFTTARKEVDIPLLRKDFMIDEYQIYQAKAMGADVILLIAAALSIDQVRQLSAVAKDLDLEVLLEIHQESELDYIGENIDMVGVNNRNLATFQTDINYSLRLGEKIPPAFLKISESGISQAQTIKDLRAVGFRGFLMGENFMKENEPAVALQSFINELL